MAWYCWICLLIGFALEIGAIYETIQDYGLDLAYLIMAACGAGMVWLAFFLNEHMLKFTALLIIFVLLPIIALIVKHLPRIISALRHKKAHIIMKINAFKNKRADEETYTACRPQIAESAKFKAFLTYLEANISHVIFAEVPADRSDVTLTLSYCEPLYVPDYKTQQMVLNRAGKTENVTFFALEAGERDWAPAEIRALHDLVDEALEAYPFEQRQLADSDDWYYVRSDVPDFSGAVKSPY